MGSLVFKCTTEVVVELSYRPNFGEKEQCLCQLIPPKVCLAYSLLPELHPNSVTVSGHHDNNYGNSPIH